MIDILKQLMTRDVVLLEPEGLTEPEMILRAAGDLLIKSGSITDRYLTEVLETYQRLGPYFVLAPGVAMPHARPSDAVKKTGICFIRLKEPVKFGHPDNDPVKLAFLLAGTGSGDHLELLGELSGILSNDLCMQKLMEAKTYEEIEAVLP